MQISFRRRNENKIRIKKNAMHVSPFNHIGIHCHEIKVDNHNIDSELLKRFSFTEKPFHKGIVRD